MILDVLTLALKNKFDTDERKGVHVSDLILCSRKAAFRSLSPQALTIKELNFFTSGRAIHDAIQILAQQEPKFEIEKQVSYKKIVGHIDLYDTEENVPIECKSMRVKEVKEPKSHHVEQLKSYMAMVGATKGIILYQCLLNFDEKPFVEFEIDMTEKEIKERLEKLDEDAGNYENALDTKSPMILPGVINNPSLNWLCKSCPYLEKCEVDKN